MIYFPLYWDKTNPYAVKQYEKCKGYYNKTSENMTEKFTDIFYPSNFFIFFCIFVLIYSIISFILIIIKRKAYEKLNWSINLSLIFTFGTIINILNSFFQRVNLSLNIIIYT